jgi:hypothetical protein
VDSKPWRSRAQRKLSADSLKLNLERGLLATKILAVFAAGAWAYFGYWKEQVINPEVWVRVESLPYTTDSRLIVVHVQEKNVGKRPVMLKPDGLEVRVRAIPRNSSMGVLPVQNQKALIATRDVLRRYPEGVEIDAGTTFEDLVLFVLSPGYYHFEARMDLENGDYVNGEAVAKVD